jgi:hypothetical protein
MLIQVLLAFGVAGFVCALAKKLWALSIARHTVNMHRLAKELAESADFEENVEKQQHYCEITRLLNDFYQNKNK